MLAGPSTTSTSGPSTHDARSIGMVNVNTTYQAHSVGPDGRLESIPYLQKSSVFDDEHEEEQVGWDAKVTPKSARRTSKAESIARAEGEEDSYGLVPGPDDREGRSVAWKIMPSIDGSKTSLNEA